MAAKTRTVYQCSSCGDTFIAWMGQCPSCKTWNSFEEKIENRNDTKKGESAAADFRPPQSLDKLSRSDFKRISTNIMEMDKVLGGGLVAGSVVLLGGEPGVGKSTLLLEFGRSGKRILYVAGEESMEQVYTRAERTGSLYPNITVFQETSLDTIMEQAEKIKSEILLVDSIQTITSGGSGNTGSPTQLKYAASAFIDFARKYNVPVVMTGHITKEGQIAGPKLLEHAVDVVLYFENQRFGQYRFVRSSKNRFGSTGEIAIFEMAAEGLKEVSGQRNLLQMQNVGGIGSILFPQVDGSRAMLVELQVLVTPASYASGRRIGENIDVSRIHMISAILEKYAGFNIAQSDIFVRVQGGAYMRDSAGDLALLVAMASSFLNIELPARWAAAGELSLTGNIRLCSHLETRRNLLVSHQIPNVLWGGAQGGARTGSGEAVGTSGLAREYYFGTVKECIEKIFQKK